ncbi:uncharacterized protein FMAN_01770 [Fusarium mangiferae]|uniref:Uncharacterized protein n=1 Tax=Fusarium mangiferae TaxID=192010 RepID=A0A1L7SLZ4_FUSMA|nr:uncharacterized protein FMAN_01770 [Fusarium mangiferae]CVK84844.1 uncharacterized protein FMAN_01770 [Fusarium mangiferae]
MQIITVTAALFASLALARDFTLYDNSYFGGASHRETRNDDDACWNMNGKGDRASSVKGYGCTTFYRERDCKGDKWENVHDASTVPSFLNDHIWSFRNKCKCDYKARDTCVTACEWACGVNNPLPQICRSKCFPNCRDGAGCV